MYPPSSKNGKFFRVRLKAPTIKEALVTLEGEVTLGAGDKANIVRATLLLHQESVFPLRNDAVIRITPTRNPAPAVFHLDPKDCPAGTLFYRVVFEKILSDGRSEVLSQPLAIAGPQQSFGVRVNDEIEFSFKPVL